MLFIKSLLQEVHVLEKVLQWKKLQNSLNKEVIVYLLYQKYQQWWFYQEV